MNERGEWLRVPAERLDRIDSPRAWVRLLAGLAVVFAVFQAAGHAFDSGRGQAGIVIAAIVLTGLVAVERYLFGEPPMAALHALGLGRPALRGVGAAAAASGLLLLVIPAFAAIEAVPLSLLPGWLYTLSGLFAQAGVAEEALFRGYLFRHLHRGRSFWQAATLSMLPFLAVHLFMFVTLPWPVALASLLLAAVISFPLAHLFVLGGNTLWAPALLHFAVQGALKVVAIPPEAATQLPLVWMAASATLPLLVLLLPRRQGA